MKRQVSLREANQHFSRYVAVAERGEEVIITRRGKPVARLLPAVRRRTLTREQKAALDRLLRAAYHLGGKKFDREACYAGRR
jgi:prevent-host-death family protein